MSECWSRTDRFDHMSEYWSSADAVSAIPSRWREGTGGGRGKEGASMNFEVRNFDQYKVEQYYFDEYNT
jgi:hypothetical protein